jgi:hypothetical protein
MSHSSPLSPAEKIAVAAIVWGCMVIVCIPLREVVTALPFCLPLWARVEFPTCLPTISIMETVEYWFGTKPDFGSIMGRYWPAGLMASAITILFMGWYWRRW